MNKKYRKHILMPFMPSSRLSVGCQLDGKVVSVKGFYDYACIDKEVLNTTVNT